MTGRSKKQVEFNVFMSRQVMMTYDEIGDQLGLTKGEVKVIYQRALRKLRRTNFIRHMELRDHIEP